MARSLAWGATGDPNTPWAAKVDGTSWHVRLNDFTGMIQTDAYEVYQSLEQSLERKELRIERIGCLAHSRRRFYAALQQNLPDAVWFISQIRRLYQIEDEARELVPPERYLLRQQCAPAIWEALYSAYPRHGRITTQGETGSCLEIKGLQNPTEF